jgi:hypothetical protein
MQRNWSFLFSLTSKLFKWFQLHEGISLPNIWLERGKCFTCVSQVRWNESSAYCYHLITLTLLSPQSNHRFNMCIQFLFSVSLFNLTFIYALTKCCGCSYTLLGNSNCLNSLVSHLVRILKALWTFSLLQHSWGLRYTPIHNSCCLCNELCPYVGHKFTKTPRTVPLSL